MPNYLYYGQTNVYSNIDNNDASYVIYIQGKEFTMWMVPGTLED